MKDLIFKLKIYNPLYCLIESEMGVSRLPIHKAIIVVATGYGKIIPKRKINWC